MINGRWNRMPCNCCNDLQSVGRAAEKRSWRAEAQAELVEDLNEDEHTLFHECKVRCDICGFAGLHITEVYYREDIDVMICLDCKDRADMISVLNDTFMSELDLSDPWISVR